jgi:ribosomal-protein-alanine N-acetyltransferase
MLQPPLPYSLRPLTVADLPAVSVIEQASFPTPTKESAYHYELTQNQLAHYQALLIQSETGPEQLAGYAGYWVLADEIHVSIIAVPPHLRRRSLGELLFLNLLYLAYDEQAVLVTLEVRERNVTAQALYAKYRFEIVGQRPRYYRDTGEDAILMTVMLQDNPSYRPFLDEQRERLFARLRSAPDGRG